MNDAFLNEPALPLRPGWYRGADGTYRCVERAGCGHVTYGGLANPWSELHATEPEFRTWLFGVSR